MTPFEKALQIINAVSPFVVILIGFIVSLVVSAFKKIVLEKIDENRIDIKAMKEFVDLKITSLSDGLTKMREEILREYVTKESFSDNMAAHEKIWVEINAVKNTSSKLEERIENTQKNVEKVENKIEDVRNKITN